MAKPVIGDKHVLDRAIQKNQKYDALRSTLDTGHNVLNTKAPGAGEKAVRALEHFKRVKVNKLFRMMADEQDVKVLLIDVREKEDYEACRIDGATWYNPLMLCRAMNPFLPEMYSYKNKDNHLIVAYDLEDTHVAGKTANLLFEKGLDNIYVLTGGLRDWLRDYPDMVVGDGPTPTPAPASDNRPTRCFPGDDAASSVSRCSTTNRAGSSVSCSSHKPKALASSLSRASSSAWR
eukprot:TRINITY_DN3411_c0_g3_i1.p2 TRINITY_DN3411_c0_g3~~TRINITY_DN3411_c0_g3_i1.p2  ORF type:complete len:234 (+),score=86.42 TRINITY_DN3411_c0_g3_i1:1606-2307(+)